MKKWIIWLLACMMLLTACVTEQPETSDQSQVEEPVPKYTLVSVGKPYTANGFSDNKNYEDLFGQQLTDGQITPDIGVHYTDTRMVGFVDQSTILIDLGEAFPITAMAVRSLDMTKDGVGLANSVRFEVSEDGTNYQIIQVRKFELTGEKTVSTCKYDLVEDGKEIKNYRYVRLTVTGRGGYWFYFLDEVQVFADVPETEKPLFSQLAYENENIDRQAWKELSSEKLASPVDIVNIADGKEYTFDNCNFDERAPQNAAILTDSMRTSRLFGDKDTWVGFNGNGDKAPSITFKLGRRPNLCSFKVHALGAGLGVKYPEYIDVYGSVNGKTYILLGRMYAPADCDNYAYSLTMLEYISCSYIKFEFPKTDDGYYWVEEIQIYTGYNEKQNNSVYPDLSFPEVSSDIYWDKIDADVDTVQNLLIGADQQMAAMYYDGLEENEWATKYPKLSAYDFEGLHDGKFAVSDDCYSGEYWFTRGVCTEIFYDLGAISSIQKLTVNALELGGAAIYSPKNVTVFLSNDGDNWYKVGAEGKADGYKASPTAIRVKYEFALEKPVEARFVRFRIERDRYSATFTFLDEIEAIGTKSISADTIKLSDLGIDPVIYYTHAEKAEYVNLDNSTMNAKDLALIVGNTGSENMLLPFVAYLDEEGNVKDTFMDGFIYWGPPVLPSGGAMYSESVKRDWEHMMKITFDGCNGLDKLEEVVGQVKETLNMPDYTVKVYFSMLTIMDNITDFGTGSYIDSNGNLVVKEAVTYTDEEGNEFVYDGDCDGDGVNEDLTTSQGRINVFNWYINSVKKEFEARGYKNIVLDGFNWCNESVQYGNDDSHIMTEAGQCVENADTNFIWIPFYEANRFYLGDEMKFDAVCMQPNYVFTNDAPLWRFFTSAEATKTLNMSIEIEHSYQCLGDPDYARSYMLYLMYGVEYGYMDGIHMYYQDTENYALMAYSDNPLCRLQYDATYHFIKGDLDITPDVKEKINVSGSASTIITGNLNPDNAIEFYTLVKQPEHGYISLNAEGQFCYYPEKGYTGTDTFTYTYNKLLGESEECTVEINIG